MKTLLVALLLLVVGTSTASAECAWVLWSTAMKRSTEPVDAFKTKDECDRSFARAAAKEEQRRKTDEDTKYFYVCLPDTVDPRGPKGK